MTEPMNRLQEWGADPADAISRMVDDEQLYFKLLKRFSTNRRWEVLEAAIRQNNFAEAFREAHDLKGNAAVLGLTPLWNTISPIVEDLREEEPAQSLREDLEAFQKEIAFFQKIIGQH